MKTANKSALFQDVDIPGIIDAFGAAVQRLFNSFPTMTPEKMAALIANLFVVVCATTVQRLHDLQIKKAHCAQICTDEAADLKADLKNGVIPKHSPGEKAFSLPNSALGKLAFFMFAITGVTIAILEWCNFGYYLRFFTDSFLLGLS